MKTFLLPGYSERNLEWAKELKKELSPEVDLTFHTWEHWQDKNSSNLSIGKEKEKILDKLGNGRVNIIAKSVGTRVLMHLVPDIKDRLNKVILCGIPTKFNSDKPRELYKKGLTLLSPTQLIIFQNEKDPLANYGVIEKFVHSVNEKIKVNKMPRSDHHYPYAEEFKRVLSA